MSDKLSVTSEKLPGPAMKLTGAPP